MIEYRDGLFGEIEPTESIFSKLPDLVAFGQVKAVHFGSPTELQSVKEGSSLAERIQAIEERLAKVVPKESPIRMPTYEERVLLGLMCKDEP